MDATLEHVQDPQGTVKVQVSSRLTKLQARFCFGGSFHEDMRMSILPGCKQLYSLTLLDFCGVTSHAKLYCI